MEVPALDPVPPLSFLDFLYRFLGDGVAHHLGYILLHLSGDVSLGIQREACAVVSKNAGDRLDIYSLLDRQRGERMFQSVKGNVFGDPSFL